MHRRTSQLSVLLGDQATADSMPAHVPRSGMTNDEQQGAFDDKTGSLGDRSDEDNATSTPEVQEKLPDGPATASAATPGPPNGGTQAWIQVLCSFLLFFNTWGILNTFGVYQTWYEGGELFQESSSNISWIGSIQAVMVSVQAFKRQLHGPWAAADTQIPRRS